MESDENVFKTMESMESPIDAAVYVLKHFREWVSIMWDHVGGLTENTAAEYICDDMFSKLGIVNATGIKFGLSELSGIRFRDKQVDLQKAVNQLLRDINETHRQFENKAKSRDRSQMADRGRTQWTSRLEDEEKYFFSDQQFDKLNGDIDVLYATVQQLKDPFPERLKAKLLDRIAKMRDDLAKEMISLGGILGVLVDCDVSKAVIENDGERRALALSIRDVLADLYVSVKNKASKYFGAEYETEMLLPAPDEVEGQ